MQFDEEFVAYIVKNLVNNPDQVTTERKVDDQGVLITVHTASDDIGYVIGKAGKTAIAIRTLLATLGAKHNMRISFRIDAPDNGRRRPEEGAPAGSAPRTEDFSVDSLTF